MDKILEHLLGTVSAAFRHVMPGAVALGLVRLARPEWLRWVCLSESTHLVLLGIVALVVGNLIYAIHKLTVHQIFDWVNASCPNLQNYARIIAVMIANHHHRFGEGVRGFFDQRNAQIILMSITGELTMLSSFVGSPGSFANDYPWQMCGSGFLIWILSFVAQKLSFRVAQQDAALQMPNALSNSAGEAQARKSEDDAKK